MIRVPLVSVGVGQAAAEPAGRPEAEGGAPEAGGLLLLLRLLLGARRVGGEAERGREPRDLMRTRGLFSSFHEFFLYNVCQIYTGLG